jgi:hypothetical protein
MSTWLLLALQLYVRWSNRCHAILQVEDVWVVQPRCDASGDEATKVLLQQHPSATIRRCGSATAVTRSTCHHDADAWCTAGVVRGERTHRTDGGR